MNNPNEYKAMNYDGEWRTGYYLQKFDSFNEEYVDYLYTRGLGDQPINSNTLCKLITTLDNNIDIYEYDCYMQKNSRYLIYFYYNQFGILIKKVLDTEENMREEGHHYATEYDFEKLIANNSIYIGNWQQGKDYLLNQM